MTDIKRVAYRKGCTQTLNLGPPQQQAVAANNSTNITAKKQNNSKTVPKFEVNLGQVRSADRKHKASKIAAQSTIAAQKSQTPQRYHNKQKMLQGKTQPTVTVISQQETCA